MIKGLSKEEALLVMNSVAQFNKIVKNYIKMKRLEERKANES